MRTISVLTLTTILTVSLIAAYPLMQVYAGGPPPPKDLSTWTAENYDQVGDDDLIFGGAFFPNATWSLSGGDTVATENVQGQPTVYISNFTAQNMKHTVVWNTTSDDDDYIGFALGYNLNDNSTEAADYLLVDWKGGTQFFNFNTTVTEFCAGGTADVGLALSRVFGVPDPDEFWQHDDLGCGALEGNVTEIVRATNLGGTGFTIDTDVIFDIIFTSNGITVLVDGIPEISQSGDFSGITGNFTFYDFSQPDANFKDVTMMDLEGCSSGFWKTDTKGKFDLQWTTHLPGDEYDTVFGEAILLPAKGNKDPNADPTLLEALKAKGGKINALAREAVAALLNSVDTSIMYPLTEDQVIAIVDAAVADGSDEAIENARAVLFDLNHAGCPLSHILDVS